MEVIEECINVRREGKIRCRKIKVVKSKMKKVLGERVRD